MTLLLAALAATDGVLLAALAGAHRDRIAHAADAAEHALARRRGGRHARALSAPRPLKPLRYAGAHRPGGAATVTLKELAA